MKSGEILRLTLLAGLAAGAIATVMKPGAAMPGPGEPFYQGALCVHQPREAPVAVSAAVDAGGGT